MKKFLLILIIAITGGIFSSVYAQEIAVSGVVTDENDEPMIGVTISEKGTTNATMSDHDGRYSIKVAGKSSIVVFSFIGYTTIEEKVDNKTRIDASMYNQSIDMEEVIVVGYGTQKKASVVGAISSADVEGMIKTGTTNLTQAIGGRISGVITRAPSGLPGDDDAQVFIRGRGSYNDGSYNPLVLVDGIEREYSQIDPLDIESFNVLKDASATAVYGVRGANGVILITTKRGSVGKATVNFRANLMANAPMRLPKPLGSYDYARLKNEALNNVGQVAEYSAYDLEMFRTGASPFTHPDNNYIEDFMKDYSFKQQYNLTVRGGTPFVKYYVSANYLKEDGLYKTFGNKDYNTNSFFNRYAIRSNLDFNITSTTVATVDLSGRLEERHRTGYDEGKLYENLVRTPPDAFNYQNPDGSFGGNLNLVNPYAVLSKYGYIEGKKNVFEVAIKLSQKLDFITEGLSARGLFGFVSSMNNRKYLREIPNLWRYTRQGEYELVREQETISIQDTGSGSQGPHRRNYTAEFQLNYNRTVGDHNILALLAYNRLEVNYNQVLPTGYINYVGRLAYGYKNRYLAEFNAGYNGSMQFHPSKRYGFFPAFSAGWVISEEDFWDKGARTFSYLKIRGSYGEVGNDKIGSAAYYYLQFYPELTSNRPIFGGTTQIVVNRIYEGKQGNTTVGWERAKKINIGIDTKFLNNKLGLTFDVFHEKRVDILDYDRSFSTIHGMLGADNGARGYAPSNLGEVRNQGLDFDISYDDKIGNVKYYAKGNFSFARNKVLKKGEDAVAYPWMSNIDRPIAQRYGYICDGFYNTQEEIDALPSALTSNLKLGDLKYRDINGDGIIDSYDQYPIGRPRLPEMMYGITLGAEWKGFDLELFFQGSANSMISVSGYGYWEFTNLGSVKEHHLGRWTPENKEKATYPSLSPTTSEQNHVNSTFWLKNGSFFRFKNFQLGYSLPKSILSKVNLSNVRFYISATNVFTLSEFKEYDPETSDGAGGSYPQLRQFNAGVSLNF